MRINHTIANQLWALKAQKKVSIKTKLFDAIEFKFGQSHFRYTDIVKTLVEDIKGWVYDHREHRGYYATNICYNGYNGRKPSYLQNPGRDGRYLVKKYINNTPLWTLEGSKN